jgi:hypothetical protein
VARAARFLSECSILLFREKLTRQQHAVFEMALAMTDVETAVALCKAAAKEDDELLSAQSRIYAAEVAMSVSRRLLSLFLSAGVLDQAQQEALLGKADLEGAAKMSAGLMADMDLVARRITA